jgi:hypothetical protein
VKLQVQSLWSTDLNLPQADFADECSDFKVGVQVSIGEQDTQQAETFSLVVCSPSALPGVEPGGFFANSLVLESFDWQEILGRIERQLMRCDSCPNWATALEKLSGSMLHEGAA